MNWDKSWSKASILGGAWKRLAGRYFKTSIAYEQMGTMLAEVCLLTLEKQVPVWAASAEEAVSHVTQDTECDADVSARFRRELSVLVYVFCRIATDVYGPKDPEQRRRIVHAFDRRIDAGLDGAFLLFTDKRWEYYAPFFLERGRDPDFGSALACRFTQFWLGGENSSNEPLLGCGLSKQLRAIRRR